MLYFPKAVLNSPNPNNEITILILGDSCQQFEDALYKQCRAAGDNKENEEAEPITKFRTLRKVTLNPQVLNWDADFPWIDYIVVLKNALRSSCLSAFGDELRLLNPLFLVGKRVDLFLFKLESEPPAVTVDEKKTFCQEFRTCLTLLRIEDGVSLDYHAGLCLGKAKRVINNPVVH